MTAEPIAIDLLNITGGTQPREAINDEVVQEYASLIKQGAELPPVVVFHDGAEMWLADGFHRCHAHKRAGLSEIAADVRQGEKRDAVLYACGANATHGLQRTNADKRKAVTILLEDEEWRQWSDHEIARRCHVSHNFVGKLRKDHTSHMTSMNDDPGLKTSISDGRTFVHHKTGQPAKMQTKSIGRAAKEPDPEPVDTNQPLDREGNPIPAHLTWAFDTEARAPFRAILSDLRRAEAQFIEVADKPYGFLSQTFLQAFGIDLGNLKSHVKASRPHAVCPYCKGDKDRPEDCGACKNAGFVNYVIWSGAPEDIREALKQ